MAINVTLVDTEGFDWDFQSDRTLTLNGASPTGLGLFDGENDAVDSGFVLVVNGVGYNPDRASVDLLGRELNGAAVMIGGIAVQRSILVSDAALSATGFARFFDSFTNTTDSEQTITVDIVLNSGADANLQIPLTSSGDTVLSSTDLGFTLDDANLTGDDSALAFVYADRLTAFGSPSSVSQVDDTIAITYTLTLGAGETQSLLSFATQSATAAQANADLARFKVDASALNTAGFLAGLSRDEQLTVQNYTGFQTLQDPITLYDSEGNGWSIDTAGRLSSLDTNALANFEMFNLNLAYDSFAGFLVEDEKNQVTVFNNGFEQSPDSFVSYTYRALPDQGVVRLLVTWQGGSLEFANTRVTAVATTGANPALVPNQAIVPSGPTQGKATGVVLDDSESGSGGTLPALTFVFGVTGAADTSRLTESNLNIDFFGQGVGAFGITQYLYYFALNDTGLAALTDLTRFNTPGPRELMGLSRDQVAAIENFDLTEADRLQTTLGTAGDDAITGNAWGDSIVGGLGEDEIDAGSSDDVVVGAGGDDALFGRDGADTLNGGTDLDTAFGGEGDDVIDGGTGNDRLYGGADNDSVIGGDGDDTVTGGLGLDTLSGGNGADRMAGHGNDDRLNGGAGFDTLFGGDGNDRLDGSTDGGLLFGGGGADSLIGGTGASVLNGDSGNDTLEGGIAGDQLFGGESADRLIGGGGNDTLDGGLGGDTMAGGTDSDTFIVDNLLDAVVESAASTGTDLVLASVSFAIGTQHIENVTLTGTSAIDATGGALDNRLTGNSAVNLLNGDDGDDVLTGGQGNDTLIGGEGNDTLIGGNGNDTLTASNGADTIIFTLPASSSNRDTITDFAVGLDELQFTQSAFTGLALGPLAQEDFVNGAFALDASDRILYDITTGRLWYDADGTDAISRVLVATFSDFAPVDFDNIVVI